MGVPGTTPSLWPPSEGLTCASMVALVGPGPRAGVELAAVGAGVVEDGRAGDDAELVAALGGLDLRDDLGLAGVGEVDDVEAGAGGDGGDDAAGRGGDDGGAAAGGLDLADLAGVGGVADVGAV